MPDTLRCRVRRALLHLSLLIFATSPAWAQGQPQTVTTWDPAVGEDYHFEAQLGFWTPKPEITLSSASLGIVGSQIDFVKDLGIESARFREIRLIGRPAKKHKFRFAYIPINYGVTDARLTRTLTFNGVRYPIDIPVTAALTWKAYRFGYEYDFVYRDRGFVGVVVDTKYTDITATLSSRAANEFAHAKAPIPTIGGIGRVYVAPNVSITGELTGLKVGPIGDKQYEGRYFDFDLYGTANFTNNVGAQLGYRSLDVSYTIDRDNGTLKTRGFYFSGVVRF
ncbi:MAG: hypothetical protein U0Q12_07200 [Vicinamibacterales bacterium]